MRQTRERRLHLPTLTSNMQGEGSTSAQTIAGMWNLSGGCRTMCPCCWTVLRTGSTPVFDFVARGVCIISWLVSCLLFDVRLCVCALALEPLGPFTFFERRFIIGLGPVCNQAATRNRLHAWSAFMTSYRTWPRWWIRPPFVRSRRRFTESTAPSSPPATTRPRTSSLTPPFTTRTSRW